MNKTTRYFSLFTGTILLLYITHNSSPMADHSDNFTISPHTIQNWSLTEIKNFLRHAENAHFSEIIELIIQRTAEKIISNEFELTSFINFPSLYIRSLSLQPPNNRLVRYLLTEKLLKLDPLNIQQEQLYESPKNWKITYKNHSWIIKTAISLPEALILRAAYNTKVNFKGTNLALSIIFHSLLKKIQPNFALEHKVAKALIAYDLNFARTIINYASKIKDHS